MLKQTTLNELASEITSYANKQEIQNQVLNILKEHDQLRLRSYIQNEIDAMLKGEYSRWGLSHKIHLITKLDYESTNLIAIKLFDTAFKDIVKKIDQVYELRERQKELDKKHEEEEAYITRPLNLKDIFEEGGQEEKKEDIQIVDMVTDAPDIRRITKEQEQNAVKEIMSQITLSLNEDQKRRLEHAVLSRLKSVRDAVDTRLALTRSKDTGGIGLTDSEASNVSILIEDYMKSSWPPPFNPKIDIDEKKDNKNPTPLLLDDLISSGSIKEPDNILEIDADTKKTNKHGKAVKKKTEMEEKREAVLAKISEPEQKNEKKSLFAKKKKHAPRLVGPADELKDMTIDDWRSLYADEGDAKRGIKAKIERLGKDSFKKKLDGIKAWREGSIMKLYLDIGKMSIEGEKSVKEIIQNLKINGRPYLTDSEFHAIMDLNKDIRLMA